MTQEPPGNDPGREQQPDAGDQPQPQWPGAEPGPREEATSQPPPADQQSEPGPPPPPPGQQPGRGAPPPPSSPPPRPGAADLPPGQPPRRPGLGYYEGPWPPEGMGSSRDSFWGVVWRTTTRTVIIATIGGLAFVVAISMFFLVMVLAIAALFDFDDVDPDALETEFLYGVRDSDNELLAIRVEGLILGERRAEGWFDLGFTYGYEVKDELRKAARDPDIAGVVLIISTPGGTIFGSQAIAEGVQEYQALTGKPVLAYISGLSASGGVWSMAPADLILADHGSLIGSIGVIMGPFTHYDGVIATEGGILGGGITTTDGITTEYITAGRSKDVGNPWRPLTDEERAVFQAGIDAEYDNFVQHVSTNLGIPEDTIRQDMGAHIFDNATARAFGLIDGTAGMDDAFAELAAMAGLPANDWQVREVERGLGFFAGLFEQDLPPPAVERALEPPPEACFPRGTALAYYGDISQLCWR